MTHALSSAIAYDNAMSIPMLTILIAVYNEAQALPVLHPRIMKTLDDVQLQHADILYVDDGSTDDSWTVLTALANGDRRVKLLRLSRNFGKETALTAGLDHIESGAVFILDADGQDPPELLPAFIQKLQQGYDNIYGMRTQRSGESVFKRGTAHLFYRVMQRLSKTPIPQDTGDFRLLSSRHVQSLKQMRERNRFMKGLFGWVGYNSVAIPYERQRRAAGKSKFNYWRLWNFALDGITSFSSAPLRLATYLGLITALVAFIYAVWIVGKALLLGDPVAGWPTMMTVILFLGGVQLVALGMIGEYLGRLYEESKQRPLYFVDQWLKNEENKDVSSYKN